MSARSSASENEARGVRRRPAREDCGVWSRWKRAQLENAYGISQLECRGGDCTWADERNDPAIGTLVHRDGMAGLLGSDQKPLPLAGDTGGRS